MAYTKQNSTKQGNENANYQPFFPLVLIFFQFPFKKMSAALFSSAAPIINLL